MNTPAPTTTNAVEHRLLRGTRLDRILVPTDFSSLSMAGIEAALSLLKGNPNARLELLHVIEPLPVAGGLQMSTPPSSESNELIESAQVEMDRLRATYGQGLDFTTRVTIGGPIRAISDMAASGQFDLVVMTSHGRSGVVRALLGSIAEGVIHHAICSVLVVKVRTDAKGHWVPGSKDFSWKNLLVGYDHRPGSVAALSLAATIAGKSNGHITLLETIPDFDTRLALNLLQDVQDNACTLAGARHRLEDVRLSYSPLSADWSVAAAIGIPCDALVDQAISARADLVVIGPHGHSRKASHLLGSTAQRLVRQAPCAVLAVK